jgi:hypothetical protein
VASGSRQTDDRREAARVPGEGLALRGDLDGTSEAFRDSTAAELTSKPAPAEARARQ